MVKGQEIRKPKQLLFFRNYKYVLTIIKMCLLYISILDIRRGPSTTQADLDLAKLQSKAFKKICAIFYIENICYFFLDEMFKGGKKAAFGKVETVGQFFFIK